MIIWKLKLKEQEPPFDHENNLQQYNTYMYTVDVP
jgi:hypothetical protein